MLLIGGRLIRWFLLLVLLAPVVASCSIQSCPQKEKFQHPCKMQPRGRSQNGQQVAPRKAIDTNIRGVKPSSRSSTQAALLTCGARGENRAYEFLHLLFYSRPLGCSCGVVLCDAVSCPLVHSYIPKSLSPVQGFLPLNEELATWRRENGFDRVEAVEKNWFGDHRSLPPTPEQYYASLWCEVNALKEAISMPARTPWQKTAEFVDGLKGKLPDWELAEIKRYVEKRCRKEAQAQAQMTAKPVGTVQHCSPISPNPDMPSNAFVKLENNEGTMSQELEELTSSSAGTGLETPGQQGPPNKGTLEQRQTTANGFLTAGVNSSQGGRTRSFADISSIAATPSKRRHKTFSEENKQFDPSRRKEKAPPWKAAATLPFFFWFLSVSSMPCSCVCFFPNY